MKLKATSLLETIVASVIFLIVFGMAMRAAVDLRKLGVDVLISNVEMAVDFRLLREVRRGHPQKISQAIAF